MTSIIKIDQNQVISRMKCELPEGVTGIGYSQQEKAVVFYRAEDGLFGFVGNDNTVRNAVRRLEVKSPSGICCDPYGLCVMQFASDMLWNFDQSYKAGRRIFGSGLFKTLSGTIPQNASSFAPYGICRISSNKIVVAVPWGNRLWTFYDQKIGEQIGSGKRGFASSSSLQSSMLDAPSGVCFDEGSGLMFVSDTGNSVIRVYKDSKETAFIGVPGMKGSSDGIGTTARLTSPASIRVNRGNIVVVDGYLVRMFKAGTLDVSTPYASSRRIIDIAMGGDSIYVLEDER